MKSKRNILQIYKHLKLTSMMLITAYLANKLFNKQLTDFSILLSFKL